MSDHLWRQIILSEKTSRQGYPYTLVPRYKSSRCYSIKNRY